MVVRREEKLTNKKQFKMQRKIVYSFILVCACLFANTPCTIGQTKSEQMKDPRPIVRFHDTSVNPFLLHENGIDFAPTK